MIPPEITLARGPDAETVGRISAEAYVPAYEAAFGAVPAPASEDYAPRIERGEVWLLHDPEPSGVTILIPESGWLMVYSIAVRPSRQGLGRGGLLLAFAEQEAERRGLAELRLYTNTRMERNLRLYERRGFRPIGRRPHPTRVGLTLVDMAKPVRTALSPPNARTLEQRAAPRAEPPSDADLGAATR